MAFRTLYEEQNNNMISGQQIPRRNYSDPSSFTGKPWQNVVGTTAEGAQINVHPSVAGSILPRIPNPNKPITQTREQASSTPTQPAQSSAPNVTPFLWNMMITMRDMTPNHVASILERSQRG